MAQTDRDGATNSPEAPPGIFTWRGVWGTGLSYAIYDAFYYNGSSYIVLTAHTSGVFATDLASGLFELMAAQGAAGAGTGDMLAANNLIEVNPVLARNNLNAALEDSEGASVTAAATTDIWATDGNTRHVTGNTTITSFGTAPQAGARMKLIFDGTPLLTQGTNLNLNAGGSNIQIEADDWAEVYADTTTQFDVVVHRKSGAAIASSPSIAILNTNVTVTDTGTNGKITHTVDGIVISEETDTARTSTIDGGTTLYPEFRCRAWVNFNGTGTPTIRGSGNVSSITDNGTGDYTINFTTAMPDTNYSIVGSVSEQSGALGPNLISVKDPSYVLTTSVRVMTRQSSTATDMQSISVAIFR